MLYEKMDMKWLSENNQPRGDNKCENNQLRGDNKCDW